MTDKLAAFRAAFPALQRWTFFGSAGVGPLPQCALDAMRETAVQLRTDFRQETWQAATGSRGRSLLARLISAPPEQIVHTKSTSEGINLLASSLRWKRGDNVVLNDLEYPANIIPWTYQAERHGIEVRIVPSTAGRVPLPTLTAAIDARTRVLSVSHVEFGNGFRHDLPALAEAVHRVGGLLCVDAIQSVGVLPVSVDDLGIDLLATGGYKWLCGPIGTGFAYVSPRLAEELDPPALGFGNLDESTSERIWQSLFDGTAPQYEPPHPSAGWRGLEAKGVPPILLEGLCAAVELFLDTGIECIAARIEELMEYAIAGCRERGLEILGPTDREERGAILTVRVPVDIADPAARAALDAHLRTEHIMAYIRGGGLRLAIHAFNTEDEIDHVLSVARSLGTA